MGSSTRDYMAKTESKLENHTHEEFRPVKKIHKRKTTQTQEELLSKEAERRKNFVLHASSAELSKVIQDREQVNDYTAFKKSYRDTSVGKIS